MNVFVCHSDQFDFKAELYQPIQKSDLLTRHHFYFPHNSDDLSNTLGLIKESDIILAEVSYPSTGVGIELGWAEVFGKRVICVYKSGATVAKSLSFVSHDFLEYRDGEELVRRLDQVLI